MSRLKGSIGFPLFVFGTAFRVAAPQTLFLLLWLLISALLAPLSAFGAKELVDAALRHDDVRATVAAGMVALSLIGSVAISLLIHPTQYQVAERCGAVVDSDVIELAAGSDGVAHLEDPACADRLELVRSGAGDFMWATLSLVLLIGVVLQLVVTCALLVTVNPLLLALPLVVVPALLVSKWADARVERARVASAQQAYMARHLLELLTKAGPAKEIRLFGLAEELRARQRRAWDLATRPVVAAELRAALARGGALFVLVAGFGGALILVVNAAVDGDKSIGSVLLTIALSTQIAQLATVALTSFSGLVGATRIEDQLRWLRNATATQTPAEQQDLTVPERIVSGIELEGLSFAYPGTERQILRGLNLRIQAGSVVALVGENGAGKTTLTKLLCRFYEPTAGRITIDGIDVRKIPPAEWREHITVSLQDFARFEVLARETVGIGNIDLIDDDVRVRDALDQASAGDVVKTLPNGLESQLGRSWSNGSELSSGQWQKLALARAMMRSSPLLLLLDEPSSALDAHAEHLLFERYAETARAAAATNGAITILISHRFSTVSMADLIVVIDDGRILERGSHTELMQRNGTYARLYRTQAHAYLQ